MGESKRIKRLCGEIIKGIPKFPDNRETKETLESMPLATLLIHYLNWMSRYVSTRPRKIAIEPAVTADQRWKSLKYQINIFLEKVRSGEDLTPHLSIQPHSRGYSPATSETGTDVNRWADKDFLLNVMGFHHFHLGMKLESAGYVERTNAVLFARVSREEFTAIGIFDHSVFESTGDEMSDERRRLWETFDEHTSRGISPGSVVVSSSITTSGHPIHMVKMAQEYSRVIHEVDPKLDDPKFVEELYKSAGSEMPEKVKFEWKFNFSDIGIYEEKLNHFFMLRRGFN